MSYGCKHFNINDISDAAQPAEDRASHAAGIVVVERDPFLRECLGASAGVFFKNGSSAFARLAGLREHAFDLEATVVLLSILSLDEEEAARELSMLSEMTPQLKTLVLAKSDDQDQALAALSHGANGFVAASAGLENVIDALRFISAGEAAVPAACLMTTRTGLPVACGHLSKCPITGAEFIVIQAIRAGKSNRLIANELNISESAVETHVRHIKQKLQARDLTEIVIMSTRLSPPCVIRPEVLCDKGKDSEPMETPAE